MALRTFRSTVLSIPRAAASQPWLRPSSQRRHLATVKESPQKEETASIKDKLPNPEKHPSRFREFDLGGKVFVVTGAARGLGLTLAEALVEAGGRGVY
jgi:hypothetical protein